MGSNIIMRTLIRAVNYSNVARSTTVTTRVLPNGALLRYLGASLIYSTVGITVHRLFLRLMCNEDRSTFSRSNLAINSNLRSLNGNLHSRMNAVFSARGGNIHCVRVTRNCIARVTLSGSSRIVNCRFVGINGVLRSVHRNVSTGRTLGGGAKDCNHCTRNIGFVSPHRRWLGRKLAGNW